MRAWKALALGALGLAWTASARATEQAGAYIEAAVVPAETQISKAEPPVGGAVIRLRAARGAREPALVVARSSAAMLVGARASALVSRDGAIIPSSAVELDRVRWVAHADEQLPDELTPLEAPVATRPDENLLLWVEVAVPRGAQPGSYHGELVLQSANAQRALPIDLEVLPFSLPLRPSLATSFNPGKRSGALGPFARAALRERVTLRVVEPPPFRVTPLEGTLQLDFTNFDRNLGLLLEERGVRPSSVEISVPEAVPLPRKLEYLLAVKRHLAERDCADLLVNFGEEGSLLRGVQDSSDLPGIALVSLGADAPRAAPFWWRVGRGPAHAVGGLESDTGLPLDAAGWLGQGAPAYRVRGLAWAAFEAGAVGLFAQEPLPLLYEAEDGSPRESVRLKLLRQGIEDYELLRMAARVDGDAARAIAGGVLGNDGLPANHAVDFEAARTKLLRLIATRRTGARALRVP